jgi:hypothetical protein
MLASDTIKETKTYFAQAVADGQVRKENLVVEAILRNATRFQLFKIISIGY